MVIWISFYGSRKGLCFCSKKNQEKKLYVYYYFFRVVITSTSNSSIQWLPLCQNLHFPAFHRKIKQLLSLYSNHWSNSNRLLPIIYIFCERNLGRKGDFSSPTQHACSRTEENREALPAKAWNMPKPSTRRPADKITTKVV